MRRYLFVTFLGVAGCALAACGSNTPAADGSDAAVFPHGENARQFAVMVARGMRPIEAIRAATSVAARVMGWEEQVGSLVRENAQTPWLYIMRRRCVYGCFQQLLPYAHIFAAIELFGLSALSLQQHHHYKTEKYSRLLFLTYGSELFDTKLALKKGRLFLQTHDRRAILARN